MRVTDAQTVREKLSMHKCIELMASTQAAISRGEITLPLRSFLPVAAAGGFGVMPGWVHAEGVFGAKLISVFPDNPATRDLPAIQGCVILFDELSGSPVALVDANAITALRTAAASGAATQLLARDDAHQLALLGYGVQADSHLEAMLAVRKVDEVLVWGPSLAKATRFAQTRQTKYGISIRACATPDEAVRGADLVCAVSGASEPIVAGNDLREGAHINLVGAHSPTSREADAQVLRRGRVYTEITEFALIEAGDITIAINAGDYSADQIVGEIGALVDAQIPGRQSASDITVYKSLGNTAQDLVAANYVHRACVDG